MRWEVNAISHLYIIEQGASVGVTSNCIKIKQKDNRSRSMPIETVEGISIFGNVQLTTQCISECLRRGIVVSIYSNNGSYFGRIESTGHINTSRQRMQDQLYNTEFSLGLGKRIIRGKVKNQQVLLNRYSRERTIDISEENKMIKVCYNKIENAQSIEQLMGYEGTAAKYYFKGLSKLVDEEFKFEGRSKRPPKDPFNAMLSLGYSILMNEIYGIIEGRGLNPYFGFIHQDKEKHPTLASDLMEEWRPVIVDSVVMSLVNGHEIRKDHFRTDNEMPGIFLTNEGMKIFINKLRRKMQTSCKYLIYIDYAVSFRRAMDLQVLQLVKAIEENNYELYYPMIIR